MYTKFSTAVPPWNVSKLRSQLLNLIIRLVVGTISYGTKCVTLGSEFVSVNIFEKYNLPHQIFKKLI
jgi:hypothetical protein